MRKILAAAAVAAVATLGLAGHASAQVFYPNAPSNVPARVGGVYGYPSQQYPTYPGQYPTASHRRRDRDDRARRDRDRDDDDRGWRNDDGNRYERGSNYGYGSNGAPSRVGEHDSAARSRYGNNRDGHRDRDGR